MRYFLHDSNAFQDEKITELFMNYGYEGVGLFFTILEKLAAQEQPIKTAILKKQLFVGKKLEKCWNFMESLEIISSNNGETFNKQLLNYGEKYKINKEKNKKRISEWRKNQEDKENVTRNKVVTKQLRNDDVTTVNKSKSKVNKRKDIIYPTEQEVVEYFEQMGYNDFIARKAYHHYAPEWIDTHGKKVLNWKQKMRTNWFDNQYKIQKSAIKSQQIKNGIPIDPSWENNKF